MTARLPLSGWIDGREHRFPIRVYYEDTDAGGIVYHAAYLLFAERARTEFLRSIGWPHDRLRRETGCLWAVRHLEIGYRQPARLDDALLVVTALSRLRGASVEGTQSIRRGDQELAHLVLRLAVLGPDGRPARVPAALRDAILPFLASQESPTDP
jgi:acyl-CoA thioester hydrolase